MPDRVSYDRDDMDWTEVACPTIPGQDRLTLLHKHCRVAGISNYAAAAAFLGSVYRGVGYGPDRAPLVLRYEPENQYDPNAILVLGRLITLRPRMFRDPELIQSLEPIGHVPAHVAARLASAGRPPIVARLVHAALAKDDEGDVQCAATFDVCQG